MVSNHSNPYICTLFLHNTYHQRDTLSKHTCKGSPSLAYLLGLLSKVVQLTLTRWPMAWALDFLTPALRSNNPVVSAVSNLPEAM